MTRPREQKRFKIYCQNCGRVLGDTAKDIDGLFINCRNCRRAVRVDVKTLGQNQKFDYLHESDYNTNKVNYKSA